MTTYAVLINLCICSGGRRTNSVPPLYYPYGNAGRYHRMILPPKKIKQKDLKKNDKYCPWNEMVDLQTVFQPEGYHKRNKSSSPKRLSRRNAKRRYGFTGVKYNAVDVPLPGLQRKYISYISTYIYVCMFIMHMKT